MWQEANRGAFLKQLFRWCENVGRVWTVKGLLLDVQTSLQGQGACFSWRIWEWGGTARETLVQLLRQKESIKSCGII